MTLKKIALALAAAFLISGTANGQAAQGLNSAAKRLDKPYSYSYFPTTEPITASSVTATALATPGAITVTPVLTKVGSITTVAGASLVDGDSFVIKYAPGLTVPIEFDLSPGDGTSGGAVPYIFTALDTADQIRDGLITLLNSAAGTALTASSGGAATVSLVLDTPGAVGDTNTEAVANVGFAVTGFVNPTAATTVTVKLVACYADNTCTEAGAASSTAASTATLGASNFLRYSWSAVPRAAKYKVYRTVAPTSPATTGVIYTGTALTVDDTGLAGGGETAPTVDSTGLLKGDGLRIGTSATPGNVLTADANGYFTPQAGGGSPGGSTTQVQFNNAGAFAGDAGLTYDAATDTLTVGAAVLGKTAATRSTLYTDNVRIPGQAVTVVQSVVNDRPTILDLFPSTIDGARTTFDMATGNTWIDLVDRDLNRSLNTTDWAAARIAMYAAGTRTGVGNVTIGAVAGGAVPVPDLVIVGSNIFVAPLAFFVGDGSFWWRTGSFKVDVPVLATQYKLSALNTAPASAAATGTLGEIRVTATAIYICTATDTWVKADLATW